MVVERQNGNNTTYKKKLMDCEEYRRSSTDLDGD